MKLKKPLNLWILIGLMILFYGCAPKTMLLHAVKNPVVGKDLYVLPNGDTCMSPWYLEKILQVKIDNKEGK